VPQTKTSTPTFSSGSNTPHVSFSISFCWRHGPVEHPAFSLKQQRCPRCGKIETLNRHSVLRGNDPAQTSGQSVRGQRGGCGRTFSIVLAEVLPRHTISASLLWRWLIQLLAGLSLKAAAEQLRLPFALETVYRLRRKLRQRLDSLRTRLCREQQPPPSAQSDPWLQTAEHLQAVFPRVECPPAAFQLHFQRPFLG
jgi:transposase-like protein